MRTIAASLSVALFLITLPATAHHGFNAEFDPSQPLVVQGTITRVEWKDPHVTVQMHARGGDGRTYTWTVEMGDKQSLKNAGWSKKLLKPGDEITVNGWGARDGTVLAGASMVTLPDGRTMSAATSMVVMLEDEFISD